MTGNDVFPLDDFPLKRDASSHNMMSRDFLQNKFLPFSLHKKGGEETKEIEMGEWGIEYD
jgi:hypothetical protein